MTAQRTRSIIVILAVLFLTAVVWTVSAAAKDGAVTVKMAVGDPIKSSVGVTANFFAEKVAGVTNGRVKVDVFPDGVLFGGDQNAAVNMVEDGSLDAVILSTSVYASFEKRMNAVSLPYLFKNYDEFTSFLKGEPGQVLLESLDRLDTVGLALMIRTFRNITNSRRPIFTPDDLKGIKLRVPNNKLWVEFFKPLGVDPTPMNFKEVYTALQLKTIDGQENPVEVPLANKFYEVQTYLSMTGHISDGYILAFNKKFWNKFDAETQKAIRAAAEETAEFKLKYDLGEEERIIQELEAKGMKVNRLNDEQKTAFQKAALKLYPNFESLVGSEFMDISLKFLGRK